MSTAAPNETFDNLYICIATVENVYEGNIKDVSSQVWFIGADDATKAENEFDHGLREQGFNPMKISVNRIEEPMFALFAQYQERMKAQ